MKVTRVFSDSEGETHFEDVTIHLQNAGQIGHLSERVSVASLLFRENEPQYDYDWHNAPARQYIVLLDGRIELEVSDGESRIFAGGDILLMEDITGKGHRTRHIEHCTRRSLFIELDEQK